MSSVAVLKILSTSVSKLSVLLIELLASEHAGFELFCATKLVDVVGV